jgi:hypothetical protein
MACERKTSHWKKKLFDLPSKLKSLFFFLIPFNASRAWQILGRRTIVAPSFVILAYRWLRVCVVPLYAPSSYQKAPGPSVLQAAMLVDLWQQLDSSFHDVSGDAGTWETSRMNRHWHGAWHMFASP